MRDVTFIFVVVFVAVFSVLFVSDESAAPDCPSNLTTIAKDQSRVGE